MRGKRAKQYRKLMHRYVVSFNFREPYQVLVDAAIVQDCARFKMDMPLMLERTLQGKVKPMITQCSMRHLYAAGDQSHIALAKAFDRRRCNHHELDQPLSTLECLSSVVDPKDSGTNKHRYVVASQDTDVRAAMRAVLGVPLVYVHRSVMIMEPMAEQSEAVREREERAKFRAGLKTQEKAGLKRKRTQLEPTEADGEKRSVGGDAEAGKTQEVPKKKKRKGPKGPNPLSVMKSKKKPQHPKGGQKSDTQPEKTGKTRRKRKQPDEAHSSAERIEAAAAG